MGTVERLAAMVGGAESSGARYLPGARNKKASSRPRSAAASLSALGAAVARNPSGRPAEPILASAKAGQNDFPLDDEFKEF